MDHFMKERRIKMSIVVMPFQVYSNDDCIPINLGGEVVVTGVVEDTFSFSRRRQTGIVTI
jgi:hypothetical protein